MKGDVILMAFGFIVLLYPCKDTKTYKIVAYFIVRYLKVCYYLVTYYLVTY